MSITVVLRKVGQASPRQLEYGMQIQAPLNSPRRAYWETQAELSQMPLQKSLEQYQKIPKIPKSVVVQHKIGVRMINVKNRTKYHLQNKLK